MAEIDSAELPPPKRDYSFTTGVLYCQKRQNSTERTLLPRLALVGMSREGPLCSHLPDQEKGASSP
ncbi:hypothetical protein SGPA1_80018 [Streptomyces misionensis JCM 4497]